jgi:hypothetical protein
VGSKPSGKGDLAPLFFRDPALGNHAVKRLIVRLGRVAPTKDPVPAAVLDCVLEAVQPFSRAHAMPSF